MRIRCPSAPWPVPPPRGNEDRRKHLAFASPEPESSSTRSVAYPERPGPLLRRKRICERSPLPGADSAARSRVANSFVQRGRCIAPRICLSLSFSWLRKYTDPRMVLTPQGAQRIAVWLNQLAAVANGVPLEWSGSWSEEDMADARAAAMRQLEEREKQGD